MDGGDRKDGMCGRMVSSRKEPQWVGGDRKEVSPWGDGIFKE